MVHDAIGVVGARDFIATDGAVTWKAVNFGHEVVESSFMAHCTKDRRSKSNHQRTVADGSDSFIPGKLTSLHYLREGMHCGAIFPDILGDLITVNL